MSDPDSGMSGHWLLHDDRMGVTTWIILSPILVLGAAMASISLYALVRMNRDRVPFVFYHRPTGQKRVPGGLGACDHRHQMPRRDGSSGRPRSDDQSLEVEVNRP
jgi:hypothetical protein